MSYDLIFGRLRPGQTWDEYREDEERDLDVEAADLDAATWARIVDGVRAVLPDVRDSGGELDDEGTAIQIFCSADDAQIQVPYWYTGNDARRVLTIMYRLAAIIEAETDLRGYDPQIELPTAEAVQQLERAAEAFDRVAASLASRDIIGYDSVAN